MTLDEAIEFIVAKTELLAEHALTAEDRAFMQKWLKSFDEMWQHPRLSMQQLRSLDGELLERHLNHSTSPAAEREIRRKLFARFKTSRLRKSDEATAKRVLKRGHIADLEEYYQVKEFVTCVDNIHVIGEENYGLLDGMLDHYDGPGEEMPEPTPLPSASAAAKPSRRRPPPPFDLFLADDEKLCPPETPLETRVAFVRTKIDRVLQHVADEEQRATLDWSLRMTLDSQLGQAQTAGARIAAAEWSEHEADTCAGNQVTPAAHRAIEDELEKQFGFRRLGPTAQARLRRALQTSDALDAGNRLVIRRFIYAYPHQTLFTRADIKLAEKLIEQPSPSQPPQPSTMTPRPKTPPDLAQLCLGAVFEIAHCDKPCRVIAFDELEVLYDAYWGNAADLPNDGWTFGQSRRRCIYYRHATPLFLDGAKKLRVDPPSAELLALHRPDLPLRFARSRQLQWAERAFARPEDFLAYVERTDAALLQHPPLHASELVLIPRSAKGACQRGELVRPVNGASFPITEILWHAHRVQRPFRQPGMAGIGIYRLGLEKKGVPSYLLSCYAEPGGLMDWHENAPLAPEPRKDATS